MLCLAKRRQRASEALSRGFLASGLIQCIASSQIDVVCSYSAVACSSIEWSRERPRCPESPAELADPGVRRQAQGPLPPGAVVLQPHLQPGYESMKRSWGPVGDHYCFKVARSVHAQPCGAQRPHRSPLGQLHCPREHFMLVFPAFLPPYFLHTACYNSDRHPQFIPCILAFKPACLLMQLFSRLACVANCSSLA